MRLLGAFRGYREDRALFRGFPDGVQWQRARIDRSELDGVRFIDWDYWNAATGGTRRPVDFAARIAAGDVPAHTDLEALNELAARWLRREPMPELILVGSSPSSRLVLLEGHARLAALYLAREIPASLDVIVGFSPEIEAWGCY
jgi:hypothetical protein